MKEERLVFPQRHYEKGPTPREEAMLGQVESWIEDRQRVIRQTLQAVFTKKLSTEMAEKQSRLLEAVKGQVAAYFKHYGLTPHLPKSDDVIHMIPASDMGPVHIEILDNLSGSIGSTTDLYDSGLGGTNTLDIITIKPIEIGGHTHNKFFGDIFEAMVLAHEVYHATAPAKFNVLRELGEKLTIKMERSGVGYAHYEFGNILEDGMAVLFQERFAEAHIFPGLSKEDYKYFTSCRKIIAKKNGIPEESVILMKDFDRGTVGWTSIYPIETAIIKVLKKKLEEAGFDFYSLVENARLKNKTIALARAIEKLFGKGMYRKIISAKSEEEQKDILGTLESK